MKHLLIIATISMAACATPDTSCERLSSLSKDGLLIIIGEPCVIEPAATHRPVRIRERDTDRTRRPTVPAPYPITPVIVPVEDPVPDAEGSGCNSGRGNGSEGSPDCDPGNSGDVNQGGD